MLLRWNKLPINDSRLLAGSNEYPLGFSANEILYLMDNVHSFTVVLSAVPLGDPYEAFVGAGGTSGSLLGAINGIAAANASLAASAASGFGKTERYTVESEHLPDVDEKVNARTGITICGVGAIHTFSSGTTSLTINFSKIAKLGNLYFPQIRIQIGPDVSSALGAKAVGSVVFGNYGSIPVYSNSLTVVTGRIEISEKYDSIKLSVLKAQPSNIVYAAPEGKSLFTAFSKLSRVSISGKSAQFSVGNGRLTITIPDYTYSGNIICECDLSNQRINKFIIPDELAIF